MHRGLELLQEEETLERAYAPAFHSDVKQAEQLLAAIEAADVVLMDDNPDKLPVAIRIARKTKRIVRENIVFALGIKGIVLILGALGLANMWAAVFADVGVAMIAICNAIRTLHIK